MFSEFPFAVAANWKCIIEFISWKEGVHQLDFKTLQFVSRKFQGCWAAELNIKSTGLQEGNQAGHIKVSRSCFFLIAKLIFILTYFLWNLKQMSSAFLISFVFHGKRVWVRWKKLSKCNCFQWLGEILSVGSSLVSLANTAVVT